MFNGNVAIQGPRLCLVPYLPHHVKRYHEWMCDPQLLALTCSEPLTLAEEEENQRSWLASDDKLTFILLAPLSCLPDSVARDLLTGDAAFGCGQGWLMPPVAMIGDCNAFISKNDPEIAEVEVSIAQKEFRGKGLAKEAVQLLMTYISLHLPQVRQFVAKILTQNTPSIELFTKGLGFSLFKELKVFDEVHFLRPNDVVPVIQQPPTSSTTGPTPSTEPSASTEGGKTTEPVKPAWIKCTGYATKYREEPYNREYHEGGLVDIRFTGS